MTPEERSLLERTDKLAEENNTILRSIRRSNRFSIILRVFYWVIIIGVSFGAYYFIQPYLETMMGAYSQIQNGFSATPSNTNSIQDTANTIKDLFK